MAAKAALRWAAILTLIALTAGSPAVGETQTPDCPSRIAGLVASEFFDQMPATVPKAMTRARPIVAAGEAHLFRTAIREGARHGPNFAGHYTLIPIGCGAGTVCVAIADAQTGRVYFPPELRNATALMTDTGGQDVEILNYRKNSRLLVVIGSPNEDSERAGVSYYSWGSGKLSLTRFIPAAWLCGQPPEKHF